MFSWLQSYAKTHLFYIILIVGGVFAFRVWLQEHDARVQADEVVKQQNALVANLRTEIAATQAQAAQKVTVIQQMAKKATTASEVAKTLPSLTDLPLNPQPVPSNNAELLVESQPLIQLAEQNAECKVKLDACQQVSELKDKQLDAKDVEIKALKKKPRFFKRLLNVGKAVGVGVGIGLLISTHL